MVKCWGHDSQGQLGLDDWNNQSSPTDAVDLGAGRTATAIRAGEYHTCAILDDGSAKCWGANSYGQLGLGDTQTRGDDAGEMGDNLPRILLFSGAW